MLAARVSKRVIAARGSTPENTKTKAREDKKRASSLMGHQLPEERPVKNSAT
jgi:hypothetical protein